MKLEMIPVGTKIEIDNCLFRVVKSFNPEQVISELAASHESMPMPDYLIYEGIAERIYEESDYAYSVHQGFTKTGGHND
jgi:hypothetical protein